MLFDHRTFEHHKDPASQLLNAWSTDYVTLRQLIESLKSAGLLREASFIHDLVPHSVEPSPPLPQDNLHILYTELKKWTKNFNSSPVHNGGCLLGQGGCAEVFKGLNGCILYVWYAAIGCVLFYTVIGAKWYSKVLVFHVRGVPGHPKISSNQSHQCMSGWSVAEVW